MTETEKLTDALDALELASPVTIAEIREQYRRLAHRHHPDRTGNDSHIRMADINQAYKLLIDYCENQFIAVEDKQKSKMADDWWVQHFGDNI